MKNMGVSKVFLSPPLFPGILLLLIIFLSFALSSINQTQLHLFKNYSIRSFANQTLFISPPISPHPQTKVPANVSEIFFSTPPTSAKEERVEGERKRRRSSEKVEVGLDMARRAIRRAALWRNYTSGKKERFVPRGAIYRNPYAFHQLRNFVHLELLYIPFGMENGITNPFANPKISMTSLEKAIQSIDATEVSGIYRASAQKKRGPIVRGVLSVTVVSAENLPAMDLMGKADPFVVLQMKKTEKKNKTRVVNDSLNPAWNQTFDFVVEDGLHDMLTLEVYDHDTFGKDYMGRCILTLTRVILEGEYRDSIPLEAATSGALTLYLKWTPQPIYRDS